MAHSWIPESARCLHSWASGQPLPTIPVSVTMLGISEVTPVPDPRDDRSPLNSPVAQITNRWASSTHAWRLALTPAGNKMSPIMAAAVPCARPSPVRCNLMTICEGSLRAWCPVTEEARHGAISSLLWIAWQEGARGLLIFRPSRSGSMLGRSSVCVHLAFTLPPPHHAPSAPLVCTWDTRWLQLHFPCYHTQVSSVPTATHSDIVDLLWVAGTAKGRHTPGMHPRETVSACSEASLQTGAGYSHPFLLDRETSYPCGEAGIRIHRYVEAAAH